MKIRTILFYLTLLLLLPFAFKLKANDSGQGMSLFSKVKTEKSATVIAVKGNGDLVVEGTRTVVVGRDGAEVSN
ncbi:MAG: hypothetical protein ACREBV_06220 [Candidatus Zixiibacteriota bacterium]